MLKNQLVYPETTVKKWKRLFCVMIVIAIVTAFASATGMLPAFAAPTNPNGGGAGGGDDALNGIMDIVIDIISKAALYIGIVIVLWGVFQMVLAFRREDSEGISKQITTVVVGGVLTGFGAVANSIYEMLVK